MSLIGIDSQVNAGPTFSGISGGDISSGKRFALPKYWPLVVFAVAALAILTPTKKPKKRKKGGK